MEPTAIILLNYLKLEASHVCPYYVGGIERYRNVDTNQAYSLSLVAFYISIAFLHLANITKLLALLCLLSLDDSYCIALRDFLQP